MDDRSFFLRLQRPPEPAQQHQPQRQPEALRDGGRPDHFDAAAQGADGELQEHVHRPTPEEAEAEGFPGASHRLEGGDDDEGAGVDGQGQGEDAEDGGAVGDGVGLVEEEGHQGFCPQLGDKGTGQREQDGAGGGQGDDRPHATPSPVRIAVGHDGQHALGDALVDRVGQAVDLPYDS